MPPRDRRGLPCLDARLPHPALGPALGGAGRGQMLRLLRARFHTLQGGARLFFGFSRIQRAHMPPVGR
jgi:hypothetical protein